MKINSYQNNNLKSYGDLTNKLAKQASSPEKQQAAETALTQMGMTATDTMKKAYSLYAQNGVSPSAAEMKATNAFLNKAKGSDASKLETVAVASLKGIDITEENLSAVHSALHDTANESLTIEGLSPELKEAMMPEALKSLKLKLDQLPPAVRQRLLQTLTTFGQSSEEATTTLEGLTGGSGVAYLKLKAMLPEQVMTKLEESLQIEGLKQLLEQGMAMTAELSPHEKTGLKSLEAMADELIHMKLPDEATLKAWLNGMSQSKLEEVMTVLMERMEGNQTLADFGVEVKPNRVEQSTAEAQPRSDIAPETEEDPQVFFDTLEAWLDQSLTLAASGYGGEALLEGLSTDIKRFIVTETTVEMVKVKAEFDNFKTKSIEQLQRLNTNPKEVAQVVAKVAEKLDHMIMHTDLSLYTDMKTERKLMGLSAEFQAVAVKAQTQPQEALSDLKQLTKKLEALVFNPTKERVVLKMTEKAEQRLQIMAVEQGRGDTIEHLGPKLQPNGSAKGVMELLRQLGLNREPELMDALFSSQNDFIGKTEEKKETFKELLMQLSKGDQADEEQLVKAVEKGIAHLTGQQLLNRPDNQQESQSLFFNIPLEGQNQEMKLFVKARKTSNRMDWENCSLYVLVDLKQYGETGIRVNVSAKQLSMTISNESPGIMNVLKPVAEEMLKELQTVGYLPSEVKYSPFSRQKASDWLKPHQEQPKAVGVKPDLSKGGFEWQV